MSFAKTKVLPDAVSKKSKPSKPIPTSPRLDRVQACASIKEHSAATHGQAFARHHPVSCLFEAVSPPTCSIHKCTFKE